MATHRRLREPAPAERCPQGRLAIPRIRDVRLVGTHSVVDAALAGLDQEQSDNAFFALLPQAIASGQVPQSRLDDMVHRILRAMYEVGLFDHPASLGPVDTVADQGLAQQVEEQGAVLLKNAGGQLPLNAAMVAPSQ